MLVTAASLATAHARMCDSYSVTIPSATVRLGVSATGVLALNAVGTGNGVKHGASAKGGEATDCPLKADISAPDKIGMSMKGKLEAIDTYASSGVDCSESS